jgi:voltage-gated potassium channel Kch
MPQIEQFRASLERWFDRPGLPLRITEFGYQTTPGSDAGVAPGDQARYLGWAFEAARADPKVQMFVWFVFRDRANVPWKGGIETERGRRKAGFASFSAGAHAVDARNPIAYVPTDRPYPLVTVPVTRLGWYDAPGAEVGISYRLLRAHRLVAAEQIGVRLRRDVTVRFRPRVWPVAGLRYVLRIRAEDVQQRGVVAREADPRRATAARRRGPRRPAGSAIRCSGTVRSPRLDCPVQQKPSLGQRLRYAFDNTMSRGALSLVAWLAAVTVAMIIFFSLLVLAFHLAPRSDAGHRPGTISQLYHSLLHALDTGTVAGDTGKWPFLLVMTLVTLGGILVVSALIGVISTGLDAKLQELRKGRSFVIEQGHTLILGWSDTIFTILSELAVANASQKDPVVVVLADRDKVEMEDAVRSKLPHLGRMRVVIRSGTPIDLDDLRITNPHGARSVVVLGPDEEDPDSYVIKTVLALTQAPGRRKEPYHIVAEIHDPANLEAARLVGGDEAIFIDKRETISRLIVQASRQSGASVVYTELLDFEGDEVYFREDPALAGKTFGEALFAYEACTVIGVQSSGAVSLNPPPDTPIGSDDRVIAIAEDDATLNAAVPYQGSIDEDLITSAPSQEGKAERVLILGWNNRSPAVINEFDEYLQPGSSVTVVADYAPATQAIEKHCGALRNTTVEFRLGNTTDRRTLDSIQLGTFDHVIVMCYSDQLDVQRADARTLVTLLHLRDIASRQGATFSIASEMLDDRNRELAEVTQVDDVIVSDRVLSLMIAQISENPHLREVFDDLFAAEGSEIYLRPAEHYLAEGRATTFATIVEAARRRAETAIGYRLRSEFGDASKNYGVRVNLPKSAPIEPQAGDRVIVLAEQ